MIGPATSSGLKTASSLVITRPGFLHGIDIDAPTTGVSTIRIWDSGTATNVGKLLILQATCAAGQNSIYINNFMPRVCNNGIYAELIGTVTNFNIAYSLG